ncbi:MAG: FtsW/RodA/SpoVE family cell cycle protein [Clostridia bacterium]|jgi:cell division protein FtsW (lipid II flippase)
MNDVIELVGHINSDISNFFLKIRIKDIGIYTTVIRWVLPIFAVLIFIRCILPLLNNRKNNSPWGYLATSDNMRMPLMHWENSIGRSRLSDVVINSPYISRSHAVLTYFDSEWTIADLGSKGGVEVNGKKIIKPKNIKQGDIISLAGMDLTLVVTDEDIAKSESHSGIDGVIDGVIDDAARFGGKMKPGITLILILIFQLFGGFQLCFSSGKGVNAEVPVTFFLFILLELVHYFIIHRHAGKYFEIEFLAYFLCGIGLFVMASVSPNLLYKQFATIIIGVVLFIVLLKLIGNLDHARKLRYGLVASAIILMVLNLTVGEIRNGSKNWINLGFTTFQPMEFVKIAFVIAGASTLDRLLKTRNLTLFIIFSGACIGTLAITKDFGTALIFFCAFLVIAFMRSGDIRTIAIISSGAIICAAAVVVFIPYVSKRFSSWGHVWELASTSGYQQTNTMIATARGGLLGIGGGKGYLVNVAASGTDLVFGVISEEWGLIIALIAVLSIVSLVFFAVFSVGKCRSSFYAIAACGAGSILLMQTALNFFGSLDILPLTGVTMPFISAGGSSMIACWCLLVFIKSADERFRPEKAKGKKIELLAEGKD